MPEIRLGGLPNMADIQLGSIQIEEVRLGDELVWRNNLAPTFSVFSVNSAAVANGDSISLRRATPFTITWNSVDMEPEPPSDNIVAFRVYENNALQTTIMTMTPSPMESGTYTVSGTFYADASEAGPQDPQRVWRVEAEDDQGSVGIFSFNVNNLTFLPPVISPSSREVVGESGSQDFAYTVTADSTGINLTTTPSGSITIPAACTGISRDSSNTVSQTVNASTVGGGVTQTATPVTYTYSRTATSVVGPTFVSGTIQEGATVNAGPRGTCIASAAQQMIGCGEVLATCTGQPGMATQGRETQRTQLQRTTTTLRCNESVQSFDESRVSISPVPAPSIMVSCNDASYSNPDQLPVFPGFANPTLTPAVRGSLPCQSVCPSGTTADISEVAQGSTTIVSCTGVIPADYQGHAAGMTSTSSASLTCATLPTFLAANAGFSVADGETGAAVSATVTAGTLEGVSPPTYTNGLDTYTGTVRVPADGFTNSGGTVMPTDTATGTASFVIHIATCSSLGGDFACNGNWSSNGDTFGSGNFQPGQMRCRCLPPTATYNPGLGNTSATVSTTTCTTLGATSCT